MLSARKGGRCDEPDGARVKGKVFGSLAFDNLAGGIRLESTVISTDLRSRRLLRAIERRYCLGLHGRLEAIRR
jgi:hypothetical protein